MNFGIVKSGSVSMMLTSRDKEVSLLKLHEVKVKYEETELEVVKKISPFRKVFFEVDFPIVHLVTNDDRFVIAGIDSKDVSVGELGEDGMVTGPLPLKGLQGTVHSVEWVNTDVIVVGTDCEISFYDITKDLEHTIANDLEGDIKKVSMDASRLTVYILHSSSIYRCNITDGVTGVSRMELLYVNRYSDMEFSRMEGKLMTVRDRLLSKADLENFVEESNVEVHYLKISFINHFMNNIQVMYDISEEPITGWREDISGVLTFIQNKQVFHVKGSSEMKLERVKLRRSKHSGRDIVLAASFLPGRGLLTISEDMCISYVPLGKAGDEVTFLCSTTMGFLCPYCGGIFADHRDLHRNHMQVHKGPVVCRICKVCIKKNIWGKMASMNIMHTMGHFTSIFG